MGAIMVFPEEIYQAMQADLLAAHSDDEQFGLGRAGVIRGKNEIRLLVRDWVPARPGDLEKQSGVGVRPKPQFVRAVWQRARRDKAVIFDAHSHPFSEEGVTFSGIDDASARQSFPMATRYIGPRPHAMIVVGRKSIDARYYDLTQHKVRPISEVRVLGDRLRSYVPTSYSRTHPGLGHGGAPPPSETYARQVLFLGKEGQEKFASLRAAVIGAGGLGSIVITLLVLLGFRRFVLVDHDVVEKTNLNRLFGARPDDAAKRVPKVEVMARYCLEINPNAEVVTIQDTVLNEVVWQELKTCDILIGCTDSASSRIEQNRRSVQYLIPYFDLGTGIEAAAGQVQHAGGQVRVAIPGMGCLGCIGGLNRKGAREETLSDASRRIAIARGYISGANVPAPAVASLNTAVASLAVTEMMAFVTGVKPLNRYVFYDFLHACAKTIEFPRSSDCLVCAPGGMLGAGDEGCPASASEELVLKPSSEGGENVNKKETVADLAQVAQALKARRVAFQADAGGRWLLLEGIPLGRGWSKSQSDVLIKFPEGASAPAILLPEDVRIEAKGKTCSRFVDSCVYWPGWKRLCPNMIQGDGADLVLLVLCVSGLLAMPGLCGATGCEAREKSGS